MAAVTMSKARIQTTWGSVALDIKAQSASSPSDLSTKIFCNFFMLNGDESYELTTAVIAICHFSGWSADAISDWVEWVYHTTVAPVDIWDFYMDYTTAREAGEVYNSSEIFLMQDFAKVARLPCWMRWGRGVGVKSLTSTPRPTDVWFDSDYYEMRFQENYLEQIQTFTARSDVTVDQSSRSKLLCDFSEDTRDLSRTFLADVEPMSSFHKPTPYESMILSQLGFIFADLIRDSLRGWADVLNSWRKNVPQQKFPSREAATEALYSHLDMYQDSWEAIFGIMETSDNGRPKVSEGYGQHLSAGHGSKILLGLMMIDRLCVTWGKVGLKNIEGTFGERKQIFSKFCGDRLAEDKKDCPICHDDIGGEDSQDWQGIRMDICCKQMMGNACMAAWFVQAGQRTCPYCRHVYPDEAIQALNRVGNSHLPWWQCDKRGRLFITGPYLHPPANSLSRISNPPTSD